MRLAIIRASLDHSITRNKQNHNCRKDCRFERTFTSIFIYSFFHSFNKSIYTTQLNSTKLVSQRVIYRGGTGGACPPPQKKRFWGDDFWEGDVWKLIWSCVDARNQFFQRRTGLCTANIRTGLCTADS